MKLPDIHDYEAIREFAKKEVENFNLHKITNFAGGRFQTNHPNIFLHIRYNGKLAKIEINKEGGSLFYMHPNK